VYVLADSFQIQGRTSNRNNQDNRVYVHQYQSNRAYSIELECPDQSLDIPLSLWNISYFGNSHQHADEFLFFGVRDFKHKQMANCRHQNKVQ
jgi:hypothetical protein